MVDVKAELEKTLEEIKDQFKVLEKSAYADHMPGTTVFQMRLSDGSWPAIPLLVAKAEVLSALTVLNYGNKD